MQTAFILRWASYILGKFIIDDTLFPPKQKDTVFDEDNLLLVYMHKKGT